MADVNPSGAKKGSPLLIVLIAGVALIAALLGVIVFLLLGRGEPEAATRVAADMPEQRAVVVNEDNVEEVLDEIISEPSVPKPSVPIGYYEVSMNFSWRFPDSKSPSSNAYVQNKSTNTNDVYFDVLWAEDESVTFYESPVLPRGTHINEVTLTRDLDAGTSVVFTFCDATKPFRTVDVTVTSY